MHRRLIQTKVYHKLLYSVSQEESHIPLKVAAAKKSFPGVFIIYTTCLDGCFLFYLISGNSIFSLKFIVIQSIGTAAMVMLQRYIKQVL